MSLDLIKDVVVGALLLAGSFFLIVGAVGLIRMPDVFTRMHGASVSDTMGAGLLVLGMVVEAGFTLVAVKLLIILAIFFFTGPLATHALARGALAVGIEPVLFDRSGRRRRKELGLIADFEIVQARDQAPAEPGRPGKQRKAKAAGKAARKARSPAKKTPSDGEGGPSSKR